MISGQIQEIKSTAVTRLRPPDLDGSGPKDENDTVVALLEEVTLAAAKAAQDCRAQMLDDVKVKARRILNSSLQPLPRPSRHITPGRSS